MKTLLIGLLALTSISSFCAEKEIDLECLNVGNGMQVNVHYGHTVGISIDGETFGVSSRTMNARQLFIAFGKKNEKDCGSTFESFFLEEDPTASSQEAIALLTIQKNCNLTKQLGFKCKIKP